MLFVMVNRIPKDKIQRFKEWFEEVNQRQDEARVTLTQEGVRHEQVLLVETSDGPIIIYAHELNDIDAALHAFENSTQPLDAEHKIVMDEVMGESVPFTVLFDLQK